MRLPKRSLSDHRKMRGKLDISSVGTSDIILVGDGIDKIGLANMEGECLYVQKREWRELRI
jgi:hypothetical protein